jgi:hypothetical protein
MVTIDGLMILISFLISFFLTFYILIKIKLDFLKKKKLQFVTYNLEIIVTIIITIKIIKNIIGTIKILNRN